MRIRTPEIIIFYHFIFILLYTNVIAQGNCVTSIGPVYGSPDFHEEGHCLVPTAGHDGVYIAGTKADSVLLMRLDLKGNVAWARTFDIIPGQPDIVYSLILDGEGMLICVGTSGNIFVDCSIFAFRYNPITDQLLWSKEYESIQPRDFGDVVIQLGSSGNYLMASNPSMPSLLNDMELTEIDKNNGKIITGVFSKNYDLGGSENFYDMIYENNFIYGVGRFTDGGPNSKMRHTLAKVNTSTGSLVWTKLGHVPRNLTARLYGSDLIMDQNEIYSTYFGDPVGTSATDTKMYIQKSTADGNLIWLNQYELPGTNDVSYEIIKSGNGYVVLAGQAEQPKEIILFKIDNNGVVLWAKRYLFTNLISPQTHVAASQLIEINSRLLFTGWGVSASGTTDLIFMRTDLNGEPDISCVDDQDFTIAVQVVANPSFYNVSTMQSNVTLNEISRSAEVIKTGLAPTCNVIDTLSSFIDATICQGDSIEGYTQTGQYADHFITAGGCDSTRILQLEVVNGLATLIDKEICFGESYDGYSSGGIYVDTFSSVFGCDSIRTLHLNLVYQTKNQEIEICSGRHFENHNESGIYIDTLKGINLPCDTIRQLTLIVLPPIETSIYQSVCEGRSYFGHTNEGTYTDTITTAQGCDSIRTVTIDIVSVSSTFSKASLCEGYLQGHTITGIYTDTLESVLGCDSIRTLEVSGLSKYIPNVFSPNDDGMNDVFMIVPFPDLSLDVQYFGIFDRFGDMVYETKNWPVQWNGKNKYGEPYSPGVFTYVFIYECGEEKITETGDITLVK